MAGLWKEEYRIGVDVIDEQHRQLFNKIEHLLEIAKSGSWEKNRRECMETIDFLVKYTIIHFETEEKFQKEKGYVSFEEHVKIHREFTNTVLVYKDLLNNNFSAKTLKSFIGTLLAWLVNHVCVCDKKIIKNIPIQPVESFVDTESFIKSVGNKLLTEMYNIPIQSTKRCIYKGDVEGAVIIRTIAEGKGRHLFLYGISDKLAECLYNKISGMTLPHLDFMDEIERSALMEIGNIITTYAMGCLEESSTAGIQFKSSLYVHEYNETDYNIINSVILEIMTDYGKMEILYNPLK
ncbi:MAG: bacteriohemerythrin [Lachnospiraceae bacterium]|nr:bacteriohemerythrin [Lachnospiraceae bacterium]